MTSEEPLAEVVLAVLVGHEQMTSTEVRDAIFNRRGRTAHITSVRDALNVLSNTGFLVRDVERRPHPLKPGAFRAVRVWRRVDDWVSLVRQSERRAGAPTDIRLERPGDLGPSLAGLRDRAGVSRRGLAVDVAGRAGVTQATAEDQLWRYESGRVERPDLRVLMPILEALGYELAFVRREDT